MALWLMLLIAAVVVALPFALMTLFNRGDVADARGRRISRRWRTAHRERSSPKR